LRKWKWTSQRENYNRVAVSSMKRLAILFIAVVTSFPAIHGEEPSSPASCGASASGAVLPRDAVAPLPVVRRFFPEATLETSTGPNSTAVGKPKATRSVIYANSHKSKKVTISVDQYAGSNAASAAYEEAVQKSRIVPGFRSIDVPTLGPRALIGTVTQGTETHIGLGALHGILVVGVTLAGYQPSPDTITKLISLAREEEKTVDAIGAAIVPVKQKMRALVQAQSDTLKHHP
jgi:hypothetical protein